MYVLTRTYARTATQAIKYGHLRHNAVRLFRNRVQRAEQAHLIRRIGNPDLQEPDRLQLLRHRRRQGEGDFRDSIPPRPEYLASPNLFLGTRETTIRFGIRGRYQPLRFFWFAWDIGENFVRNKNHVAGATKTEFEAVAEVGVRIDVPHR